MILKSSSNIISLFHQLVFLSEVLDIIELTVLHAWMFIHACNNNVFGFLFNISVKSDSSSLF